MFHLLQEEQRHKTLTTKIKIYTFTFVKNILDKQSDCEKGVQLMF